MKALVTGSMILFMSVVSYGGDYLMRVNSSYGTSVFYVSSVDSVTIQAIDSITDSRDGKKYATIMIGTQCWMAQNLNVGTRISGTSNQTNNGVIEKYAYDDKDSLSNIYGGLYQWDEMMQYSTTQGVQGICPLGWHIPTDAEWKTLEKALGMTQGQADSTGFRGTDQGFQLQAGGKSGFQGLFSGGRYISGSTFRYLDSGTFFWSSSQYDASNAPYRALGSSYSGVYRDNLIPKTFGFCVRCVRD
jgi:uncharacterized protein (TIGR02145 family)